LGHRRTERQNTEKLSGKKSEQAITINIFNFEKNNVIEFIQAKSS
jgi:hypothetical protein